MDSWIAFHMMVNRKVSSGEEQGDEGVGWCLDGWVGGQGEVGCMDGCMGWWIGGLVGSWLGGCVCGLVGWLACLWAGWTEELCKF